MKKARSMLLNEEFTSDDDRLTYQSYEKLALICNVCGELVFFKQGIERVSHFSHFKDTGNNKCRLRTQSHDNDSTQNTDSEAKKQSLEKFQKKIQKIIDEGIIKYQKISCSQLDDARHRKILLDRIDQGESLVNQYNIDINSWLSQFYDKREHIKNLALSSYHNKSSEIQRLVFSNIVHYLCLPASENILGNILYYVFFLLNKEVNLNNDFEVVRSKVIELIHYAEWEKESQVAQESLTFNEFPGYTHPNLPAKPTKFENERVGSGKVLFYDVIGTVPMSLRLTPAATGYHLVGLPVKLPDDLLYDHARYVVSNLGEASIGWLNAQVRDLKSRTNEIVGNYTASQMIKLFDALIVGVLDAKKLDPSSVLESKDKLKKYLSSQVFQANPLDSYYSFYQLAVLEVRTELEKVNYTYRLTNFGDERALAKNNLSSILNWVRRLSYTLKNKFQDKKPSFEEVKEHLTSTFKYKGVELKVYKTTGIFFEIVFNGVVVSKQLISIIEPVSDNKTANVLPVKMTHTPEFLNPRMYYKLLQTNSIEGADILKVVYRQLSKVCDNFIVANRDKMLPKGAVSQTTKIGDLLGFTNQRHGFGQVKKTFLKFVLPFSIESTVTLGKVFNLKTGKIINEYDASLLFEKMCKNWKQWNINKQETIELGGCVVNKPDPGKLMLCVLSAVNNNPSTSALIWGDLLEVWFNLTDEPIGFRTNTGVILTPWSIQPTRAEVWEYRIKMQLIDILRDEKVKDKKADAVESHLQLSVDRLKQILNATFPTWYSTISLDVKKHLQALDESYQLALEASTL